VRSASWADSKQQRMPETGLIPLTNVIAAVAMIRTVRKITVSVNVSILFSGEISLCLHGRCF